MDRNRSGIARVATLLLCLVLPACGGGGGGATHTSLTGSGSPVGLSFLIPSASTVAAKTRKPAFISTLTASIAVTVYPAASQPPTTPTTVANVGPTLPGCTAGTAGTTCIVTVLAPYGNDTFIISAYSGANGSGTLLSDATISQNVVAGMAPIAVTLTAAGATVTGDMLGYVPNRTWTYQVNSGTYNAYIPYGYSANTNYGVYPGGPFVVGIYADPSITNGITTLVAFVAGSGTSNPFSPSYQVAPPFTYTNDDYGIVGAMGVQSTTNGYLVSSYGSVANYSYGTVPGTPILVPSSLQLGQSWNPLANSGAMSLGVSAVATVTAVGQVPGIAYCPNSPAAGATVRYTITPLNNPATVSSVSYVPGCGITDYIASTGSEFMLTGVGSQNLGTLDVTRKTQSATLLGTLHTLWQRIFVKHTH